MDDNCVKTEETGTSGRKRFKLPNKYLTIGLVAFIVVAWINGIPVHCDVTWDGTEEGLVRFDYLNLSDNQISGDHYDFKCARVPECTSETLSYYSYRGLCVHSFNDLKTRLKKDSQRGISPILIHFSYRPASGDCLKEAQRAFSEERISGNHRLYYHPTLKNLAVK